MRVVDIIAGGLAAAVAATLTAPLHAQGHDGRGGRYDSEDGQALSVTLTPLPDDRYAISISTTVPMRDGLPGCGGSITGALQIADDAASLEVPNEGFVAGAPVSDANLEFCRIDLRFVDEHIIRMQEVSGCGYFHGAGCSFTGDVVHEASGI